MQYDVKTPEEYLEVLEDDWRKEKLLEVRRLILLYGPELEESIRYKMLYYGTGDEGVFGLNAQKHFVSLYVGDIDKIENADTLLKPFNTGKECIRICKSVDMEKTGLEEFIQAAIAQWRSGRDISC
jgi:uncharacterized protein YdhG (YjbR/CyaY superfamily)